MKNSVSIFVIVVAIITMSFNSFSQIKEVNENKFSYSSGFNYGNVIINKTDVHMRTFGMNTSAGFLRNNCRIYLGVSMAFGDSARNERIGLNQIELLSGLEYYSTVEKKARTYIGIGIKKSFLQFQDERIFEHPFNGGFAKFGITTKFSENIGLYMEISYTNLYNFKRMALYNFRPNLTVGLRFH